MDSADWTLLIYLFIAVLAFVPCVRFSWKDEIDRYKYSNTEPSLGMAGIYGLCCAVCWPLVIIVGLVMGLLALIVKGIEEK